MRMFITALTLAAAIASPALAQTMNRQTEPPRAEQRLVREPAQTQRQPAHSTNPRNDVYELDNQYVGSDPDPRVREDLERDPPERN